MGMSWAKPTLRLGFLIKFAIKGCLKSFDLAVDWVENWTSQNI